MLLVFIVSAIVVYRSPPLTEIWSDPQIEMSIPSLKPIVAAEPVDKQSLAAINDKLGAMRPDALASKRRVAIYYDDTTKYRTKWQGEIYARFLFNLMGHFDITPEILPVSHYAAGDIDAFDSIFYLGTDNSSIIPESFLGDVFDTSRTVVWIGRNLYRLAKAQNAAFAGKYGFKSYKDLRAPRVPYTEMYDVVTYKGIDLQLIAKFDTFSSAVTVKDPASYTCGLRCATPGPARSNPISCNRASSGSWTACRSCRRMANGPISPSATSCTTSSVSTIVNGIWR